MKLHKLALAGLLALASVAGASAQTTIHIVGSTAYRAAVNDAIQSALNVSAWAIGGQPDTSNSSIAAASEGVWVGTLKNNSGDGTIVVETFYTGSVAGLADLCIPHQVTGFMNPSLAVSGGTAVSTYTKQTAYPDFAWTDTDSTTDANILKGANVNAGGKTASVAINNTTLDEANGATAQGIVFFELVLGKLASGQSAPISNVTTDMLASMITQGYISLQQATGSTAASSTTSDIFLIGRNEDSGSRGNTFACAYEGGSIGGAAVQWYPTYTNSATYTDAGAPSGTSTTVEDGGVGSTLTALQEWPAGWALNTDTSISWSVAGHSGFVSGGEVASAISGTDPVSGVSVNILGNTYTPTATYLLGYLGGSDANTAINNGGTELTYNGVTYSQAGVLNGTYGLWGYEHAYYNDANSGTPLSDACDAIASQVETTTAEDDTSLTRNSSSRSAAGIFLPAHPLVVRGEPGTPITAKYNP